MNCCDLVVASPQEYPSGHGTDCVRFVIASTPHTRAAGHGMHSEMDAAPVSGSHVPCSHRRHVIESASDRYVPAEQIVGSYVP